jgi:hypothetical protein
MGCSSSQPISESKFKYNIPSGQPNYKNDRLHNLMKLTPKRLNEMISENTDIDIADIRKYKWMGLNFLHMIEIFIGFITCTSDKSGLQEWIDLRRIVVQEIPELLKDLTENTVYFSNGFTNSYITKGTTDCRFQIPFQISSIVDGMQPSSYSIMYNDSSRSYNSSNWIFIQSFFRIGIGLTYMEFLLQLQAVFKTFPVHKLNKPLKKIIEETPDVKPPPYTKPPIYYNSRCTDDGPRGC